MKAVHLIHSVLMAAVIASCASSPTTNAHTSTPQTSSLWKTHFKDDPKELENLPAILSVKWRDDPDYFEVVVKNTGSTALQFSGYSQNVPQQFHEEWVADKWQRGSWDWCGTGMEKRELLPGEERALRLNAYKPESKKRFLVAFSDAENGNESFVILVNKN